MDIGLERYGDFSEDSELLLNFDPGLISDVELKNYARLIKSYLTLQNPIARITGLIAHDSIISLAYSSRIAKTLTKILWLIVVNTALIGYIAYKLSSS